MNKRGQSQSCALGYAVEEGQAMLTHNAEDEVERETRTSADFANEVAPLALESAARPVPVPLTFPLCLAFLLLSVARDGCVMGKKTKINVNTSSWAALVVSSKF